MANMNRNIPLSIDADLLAEIDRIAEGTKESRSAVMRRAIREGLPVVEAGGSADVISLDSELSSDVGQASAEVKLNRAKLILECIRTGLQPVYNRLMREQVIDNQEHTPEQADRLLAFMEDRDRLADPMAREMRTALRQRGAAVSRLTDILENVPEARRRQELMDKLTEIHRGPGGLGGGNWGLGVSNEEMEWQLAMIEKYGVGAELPAREIKAREKARKADRPHTV